jgi:hypothetical protein
VYPMSMSILRTLAVALLLSCLPLDKAAFAQTMEVVVSRNVNLRLDSSTEQAPIRLLTPGMRLALLRPDAEDGYYFVRTAELQEGWVWAQNVKLEPVATGVSLPSKPSGRGLATSMAVGATGESVADEISERWAKPEPNKSQFTGPSGLCGYAGVGDQVESNQRKNRTDIPTRYHDVSLGALLSLPVPHGPKERTNWSAALLQQIEPYEGVAVRVIGFLAAVKPQTGSKEATNCRFSTATETDWHMALVERAGMGEERAAVVETTPRIRKNHPEWTKSNLGPWIDGHNPIRISGWLFFDTEHWNHMKKFRATLWEIHPITKIEVFTNGRWVDLDRVVR